MDLFELMERAEQEAEDWGEFRIVLSLTSDDMHYNTTDNIIATFDVEKGIVTLEEKEG